MADENDEKPTADESSSEKPTGVDALVPKGAEALVPVAKDGVAAIRDGFAVIRDTARELFANLDKIIGGNLAETYVDFRKSQTQMLLDWQRALTVLPAADRAGMLEQLIELQRDKMRHEVTLIELENAAQADRVEQEQAARGSSETRRLNRLGGLASLVFGGLALAAGTFGPAPLWVAYAGLAFGAAGLSLFQTKLGDRVLDSIRRYLNRGHDGPQQLPPDRSE